MRTCLFLAVCPLLSGCLGFAYPSISQVPAVAVTEPDVTAFHVSEKANYLTLLMPPLGETTMKEAIVQDGGIAARRSHHFTYWFICFPIAPVGSGNTHHESVRLYRPGYETVNIESQPMLLSGWGEAKRVAWKRAVTLEAREKAIRDLYAPHTYTCTYDLTEKLSPNVFVAEEFARLASSELAADAADRQRLNELADAARSGNLRISAHRHRSSAPAE